MSGSLSLSPGKGAANHAAHRRLKPLAPIVQRAEDFLPAKRAPANGTHRVKLRLADLVKDHGLQAAVARCQKEAQAARNPSPSPRRTLLSASSRARQGLRPGLPR